MAEQALSTSRPRVVLIGIIAAVAVVLFLRATAIVAIPVAAALFIAMLLRPVQRFLAARLPARAKWATLPLTMLVLLAVVAAAAGLIGVAVDQAIETAPRYRDRVAQLTERASEWARSHQLPVPERILEQSGTRQRLADLARTWLKEVGTLASGLVLVFFFTLLMLLEADVWMEKLRAVIGGTDALAAGETMTVIAA